MDTKLLKSYIKSSYKACLIGCAISIAVCILTHESAYLIFFLLQLIGGFFRYKSNLERTERLKKRGLTEEDITNISFVKSWEDTRLKGIFYYTVVQGGIFYGIAFCFIFCVLKYIFDNAFMKHISDGPEYMFKLIGQSYAVGVLAGIIVFRFLWTYNERKFIRLTDPLH